MSPAGRPAASRRSAPPPGPWQRTEAGRYRSADGRFTLESEGGGRWFVTDEVARDELGLPRTLGPYATLAEAKAAADAARVEPAAPSPLAQRLAEAATRPRLPHGDDGDEERERGVAHQDPPAPVKGGRRTGSGPRSGAASPVTPATWLDELAGRDPEAAGLARRWIAALEREGIPDAEAIVRRDVLGDRPAVATRLLADEVLAAVAALAEPSALEVAAAVAAVLASGPERAGLPGWELREQPGTAGGRGRPIHLSADDLRAAARNAGAPAASPPPTKSRSRRKDGGGHRS